MNQALEAARARRDETALALSVARDAATRAAETAEPFGAAQEAALEAERVYSAEPTDAHWSALTEARDRVTPLRRNAAAEALARESLAQAQQRADEAAALVVRLERQESAEREMLPLLPQLNEVRYAPAVARLVRAIEELEDAHGALRGEVATARALRTRADELMPLVANPRALSVLPSADTLALTAGALAAKRRGPRTMLSVPMWFDNGVNRPPPSALHSPEFTAALEAEMGKA